MTRRSLALVAAMAALLAGAFVSSLPARASHARALDPAQIDPNALRLQASQLPQPTDVCLFEPGGSISGAHVAPQQASNPGAIACGQITGYAPAVAATSTTPAQNGFIDIAGQHFVIPVGATIDGLGTVTHVDHAGVSDNSDADGYTTPADGYKAQLRIVHQNDYGPEQGKSNLGRMTGYRMDLQYPVQGTGIGTEYLASIFPSAAMAKVAMDDATVSPALITIIGAPLPQACTAGDQCKAFSGPNPGTTNKAVFAVFTRGPIMIETASQVPQAQFDQLLPTMETTLFSLLNAADQTAQAAMIPGPPTNTPGGATSTPTATPTPRPTATPVPTATPIPLTVSVTVGHGTVAAGKKQSIDVSTAPSADVTIVAKFPDGTKKTKTGTADATGSFSWSFKQPSGKTKGTNHTVKVKVTVTRGSEPSQSASKQYKIK
jgi:hypothetical protein